MFEVLWWNIDVLVEMTIESESTFDIPCIEICESWWNVAYGDMKWIENCETVVCCLWLKMMWFLELCWIKLLKMWLTYCCQAHKYRTWLFECCLVDPTLVVHIHVTIGEILDMTWHVFLIDELKLRALCINESINLYNNFDLQ